MSELIHLGSLKGHLARPVGNGPFPTVIVIQEWWGLDSQTQSIADRFAQEGYLSFAPDLYHGELAQLGDGDTAMKLVQKYGPKAYLDLQSLFDALKSHPDFNGKIGSVGFCFGGRMSLTLSLSRPANHLRSATYKSQSPCAWVIRRRGCFNPCWNSCRIRQIAR